MLHYLHQLVANFVRLQSDAGREVEVVLAGKSMWYNLLGLQNPTEWCKNNLNSDVIVQTEFVL